MFGRRQGWYIIYTFRGLLSPNGILPDAKFTLRKRSAILAALLHGTRVVGISQTLWRGTRNGIKELSQRTPPIFGRAAIALGTGPHSAATTLTGLYRCVVRERDGSEQHGNLRAVRATMQRQSTGSLSASL